MSWFVVDVESDGPAPGSELYSMISFGIVLVDDPEVSFKGLCAPISEKWVPQALAISGISREKHLTYPEPGIVMTEFLNWIVKTNHSGKPVFVSDNPAFDWQFINWYSHRYLGKNPFGHSARRIGDIYAGLCGDASQSSGFKNFRITKHTHDPVQDAKGNAEALRAMAAGATGRKFINIPGLK